MMNANTSDAETIHFVRNDSRSSLAHLSAIMWPSIAEHSPNVASNSTAPTAFVESANGQSEYLPEALNGVRRTNAWLKSLMPSQPPKYFLNVTDRMMRRRHSAERDGHDGQVVGSAGAAWGRP